MNATSPPPRVPLPKQSAPRAWAAIQLERVRRHPFVSIVVSAITVVGALGAFTDALDLTLSWSLDRCRAVGVCAPPPPNWLVGNLSEVRLGAANIPQTQAFTERELPVPTRLPPREATWPGQFITYRVEFRGMVGNVCFVEWTLIDAATGERIVDRWASEDARNGWATIHARAYPDSRWQVEADKRDAAVGTLWVPYLAPGSYQVEVELVDARGEYLDIERTPPFTVTEEDLPD